MSLNAHSIDGEAVNGVFLLPSLISFTSTSSTARVRRVNRSIAKTVASSVARVRQVLRTAHATAGSAVHQAHSFYLVLVATAGHAVSLVRQMTRSRAVTSSASVRMQRFISMAYFVVDSVSVAYHRSVRRIATVHVAEAFVIASAYRTLHYAKAVTAASRVVFSPLLTFVQRLRTAFLGESVTAPVDSGARVVLVDQPTRAILVDPEEGLPAQQHADAEVAR